MFHNDCNMLKIQISEGACPPTYWVGVNILYISIPKLKGNGLEIADCIKGFWKFLKIFTNFEELKMFQTNISHIQGIPLKILCNGVTLKLQNKQCNRKKQKTHILNTPLKMPCNPVTLKLQNKHTFEYLV